MALWLAAPAAGRGASRSLHALSRRCDRVAQLLLHAEGRAAARVCRRRQLRAARRRPDLLAGAVEQPVVRGGDDSAVDRARATDGSVGQRQASRPRPAAARLLHADGAADDRGGQYLALLIYAGVWVARE